VIVIKSYVFRVVKVSVIASFFLSLAFGVFDNSRIKKVRSLAFDQVEIVKLVGAVSDVTVYESEWIRSPGEPWSYCYKIFVTGATSQARFEVELIAGGTNERLRIVRVLRTSNN
jgi:hypothetical protein